MGHNLSSSRAILIGNGTFADKDKIPPLPAAACVAAMSELLTSELCGWPQDRIEPILDAAAPSALALRILQAVRDVDGVLLVFYVGHGIRTREGQLALALRDTVTDPEALPHTAMLYENLAGLLRACRAATKLVILDCCHAELGNKANYQFQSADLAESYPVDGLYFIGASRTHQKAKFSPARGLTYFTEAFIDTVRNGIRGQPSELRLDQIFLELRAQLVAGGLPEPVDSGIRGARQYPFALNAALRVPPAADPDDPARRTRLRILSHAERAASEINSLWGHGKLDQAEALLAIAAAAATDDLDHARRLTSKAMRLVVGADAESRGMGSIAKAMAAVNGERAERIASAIADPNSQDHAMAEVAQAIAAADPDRAERLANAITNAEWKASALAEVAEVLTASAPDRAERIAITISDRYKQASALVKVAEALAASDPGRAEKLATAASGQVGGWAVEKVVQALAGVDVDAAERVARSISDQDDRDRTLKHVAEAAAYDLERAERILATISDSERRGWAGYLVAMRRAKDDPDVAEAIARGITHAYHRCSALWSLSHYLAENDPNRAARVLGDAAQVCRSITNRADHDRQVGHVAASLAATDPENALRLARSAFDPDARTDAISGVVVSVAGADSDKARRIAATISEPYKRADTLVKAAGVAAAHDDASGARSLLGEAEPLARTVNDLRARAILLADLGIQLAAVDPDHARRVIDEAEIVARTIPDASGLFSTKPRNDALKQIVLQIVVRNQSPESSRVLRDHAERIARSIPGRSEQADALTAFARAVFSDNPERAERAALAVTFPELRVKTLIKVAAMFVPNP